MWFLRSNQTKRDRESGLTFAWRLPVGDGFQWLTAVLVVAALAGFLAVAVRVQVTAPARMPQRQASLILVPSEGEEWKALRLMAEQAGPFPVKVDWSKEPVAQEVEKKLEEITRPRPLVYEPGWSEVETAAKDRETAAMVLPELPGVEVPEGPVEAKDLVLQPLVLSGKGKVVTGGRPPQAGLRGVRAALQYGANGRVGRVTLWSPLSGQEGEPLEQWLLGARVEGGDPAGGWLVIEVSP